VIGFLEGWVDIGLREGTCNEIVIGFLDGVVDIGLREGW